MWIYKKQILVCVFANIGLILFGYSAGWPAPMFSKLQDPEQFPQVPTDEEANWIVAVVLLGAFVGSVIVSCISNSVGRKPIMVAGGLGFCVAYIGIAFVTTIPGLLAFRLLSGVCALMTYIISLVYIGEMAAALFLNLGYLSVYLTGGYASYQAVNFLALALGVFYTGGVLLAPESPVYHILNGYNVPRKYSLNLIFIFFCVTFTSLVGGMLLISLGREMEAKAALLALNRKEDAEKISELKLEVRDSSTNQDWKSLFTVKCNRRALMITIILHILQQASGPNTMGAYTTSIFEIAESSVTPYIGTIIIGVVQVLSGMITPTFVERCGRKILLLLSTTLTGLSLAVLATYLYLYDIGHPSVAQLKWLPLMIYITYCVSYTFGFSILPSVLVGEMFEMNVRSAGSAIVLSISCIAGFISVTSSGYILNSVGIYVAIATFVVPCFLASVFTVIFVPETKGKSLIEIQKILS